MRTPLLAGAALALVLSSAHAQTPASRLPPPLSVLPPEPGLLFYVSGEKATTADHAAPGTAEPTVVSEVEKIADGAHGAALRCGDVQRLAWWAPGNIYAQRGTLSFFWRSRYPVGPTEFPVFRVGYGDHSSWDMVWLRIDYNGHGFDAFVTDINLSRVRVSAKLDPFPKPTEWTHLAFTWDETRGVKLFINGKLAAENKTAVNLDAALDQFGPHSRIISPYQVQSDYNFVRGGDIDEIRIHDRALADDAIATLARLSGTGLPTRDSPLPPTGQETRATPVATSASESAARLRAFQHRYGFDRPNDPPPELPVGKTITIRKVEIHDAFDLKRWWWKATDGIRETTWPGPYNRSRLTGRNDYFQLPDWDCYVESGKAITFQLPNEPWNHLEISGSAWGKMELLKPGSALENASSAPVDALLFGRPKSQDRTAHALKTRTGGQIRFTSAEQEEPIGELSAYHVTAGTEPTASTQLGFRLEFLDTDGLAPNSGMITRTSTGAASVSVSMDSLKDREGRFVSRERSVLVAAGMGSSSRPGVSRTLVSPSLPLVHVLVPNTWQKLPDGLDGVALDLPALNIKPTHGSLLALNLRVHDPLWPARDMLDFTFSLKPGEERTLWLDLRDRILPADKSLRFTIACSSPEFSANALLGAELRLVFKPRAAARAEHELDRFTQARDSYAMLVEEHPKAARYNLWNRFEADLTDLLRVNPDHELGRRYAAAAGIPAARVPFTQPVPPEGVPLWAFRQVELLGRIKKFVNWYIDHRQAPYGDFGGGISDDTDFTNLFPGVALMGSNPEKIRDSLRALLDASYKNGLFTRGLPTIQTDELHTYEEGINCLAQNLILDFGSPRQLERAMETARGVERITGLNAAGHRHIRSSYYSGSRLAVEEPWGTSKPYSYLVCQVPQLLVDFNGHPAAKKIMLELTDGLLAHRKAPTDAATPGARGGGRRGGGGGGGTLPSAIRFTDDAELTATRGMLPWHMFWGAWKWTGDQRYLAPITDGGIGSMMAINANALDLLSLRAEWGARFGAGERGTPAETRPTDGRAPLAVSSVERSPAASFRSAAPGHFTWQLTGDKRALETLYAAQIETCAAMEFINTEGSLWIDRVGAPTNDIQRARLGGVALVRNALYPGHTVSWKFAAPATDQSVAILIPDATPTAFKVIACNLETTPVTATMTGWNIDPGTWEITLGLDANGDDTADQAITRTASFERSRSLDFTLPPRATTIITLKLKTPGTPYWSRPDLGLDREDVTRTGDTLRVRVHSLGSVAAPASAIALRDATGKTIATATTPALEAPLDLHPRTAEVTLTIPAGANLTGATVELDPEHQLTEITTPNNTIRL
ncbi:MAG: LamG domain-containing protein [Verrucomicrobia bacterium]|nr:LamG domain-containing protein [Verrucomicrobiota bacterium]